MLSIILIILISNLNLKVVNYSDIKSQFKGCQTKFIDDASFYQAFLGLLWPKRGVKKGLECLMSFCSWHWLQTQIRYPCIPVSNYWYYVIPCMISLKTGRLYSVHCTLHQYKATGQDKIPPKFLRDSAASIAPIITHIINLAIKQGHVPQDFELTKVTPLHKKGSN